MEVWLPPAEEALGQFIPARLRAGAPRARFRYGHAAERLRCTGVQWLRAAAGAQLGEPGK